MTEKTKMENTLAGQLKITRFPLNTVKFYHLDKNQDWTQKLLMELNEKAESKSPEDVFAATDLTVELEIQKLFKKEYGEYLLVKGHLSTDYITQCVRTLEDMNDSLELEINACFLDEALEHDEAFQDQVDIFEKDQMYELYFYRKGLADIYEMVHEQVYLNINQYPIKDENTPLHWGKETSGTKQ